MKPTSVERQFTVALEALVEQIKGDRSVLAAILCGSLSHDTVWAKSDIDLVLVTIDDQKVPRVGRDALRGRRQRARVPHAARAVPQDGRRLVPQLVHALAPREGPLLYTHDETIADLCERLRKIGERDTEVQLLRAATSALPAIDKAHKWFLTRGDLDYTALWILYAATPLARIEVIGARLLADREVIPQAMKLNPAFFKIVYADLLNTKKTQKNVQAALDAIDRYIAAAGAGAVRARARPPARGRRGAIGQRDRSAFHPEPRRRRGDDRLRVSGRSGPDRQGIDPRPPHEEEQRRGPGAGVLPTWGPAGWLLSCRTANDGSRRATRTTIAVQGARVHNLKNISLEIPRDSLIVVTGLSGSGKSSLAFDTIYAEGQRRYMESLSSFAKRFVAQVTKPDVDFVFGLSPVISIEQKTLTNNPRSTVGTMTDIASYLNLLFATIGQPHCPRTGEPTPSRTLEPDPRGDPLAARGHRGRAARAGLQGLRRRPGLRLHRGAQEGLPAADRRRQAGRHLRPGRARRVGDPAHGRRRRSVRRRAGSTRRRSRRASPARCSSATGCCRSTSSKARARRRRSSSTTACAARRTTSSTATSRRNSSCSTTPRAPAGRAAASAWTSSRTPSCSSPTRSGASPAAASCRRRSSTTRTRGTAA